MSSSAFPEVFRGRGPGGEVARFAEQFVVPAVFLGALDVFVVRGRFAAVSDGHPDVVRGHGFPPFLRFFPESLWFFAGGGGDGFPALF